MTHIVALHTHWAIDPQALSNTFNAIYDHIESEGLNPFWILIIPRENAINRANQLSKISIEFSQR